MSGWPFKHAQSTPRRSIGYLRTREEEENTHFVELICLEFPLGAVLCIVSEQVQEYIDLGDGNARVESITTGRATCDGSCSRAQPARLNGVGGRLCWGEGSWSEL